MSISQIATQPICPPLSASTNHNYWLSCLSAIMPIDQPSRPSYQFRHHVISLSESYAIIHINHHVYISTIMLSICHHACQPSYLIPIIPSSIRFPRFINCSINFLSSSGSWSHILNGQTSQRETQIS